jgi:flagellar biogenesis protein FliO
MSTAPQLEELHSISDRAGSRRGVSNAVQSFLIATQRAFRWIARRVKVQQARKNLRICESVSLGDKRFVAIVQVDDERFLIGGSSGSLSLLTRLQEARTFAAVLGREAEKIS